MTDMKDTPPKKPLSLSKNLDLKKVGESSHVRQSFSHGRSKTVTVEVKKKRHPSLPLESSKSETMVKIERSKNPHDAHLTSTEWESRKKALQDAIKAESERSSLPPEETRNLHEENKILIEEQNRRRTAAEAPSPAVVVAAAPTTAATPDDAQGTQPDSSPIIETSLSVEIPTTTPKIENTKSKNYHVDLDEDTEEEKNLKKNVKISADSRKLPPTATPRRIAPRRSGGKISVHQDFDKDNDRPARSLAAMRRAREREKHQMQANAEITKIVREIIIPETISIQDLANRMAVRAAEVIKHLMQMGMMVTLNQIIDADIAEIVVSEFGHIVKRVSAADVEIGLKGKEDTEEQKQPRPPVVTIMGHVDHGKTSLLDALRETDIAAHEAGGITQHIGAYQVNLKSGKKITFLDTPGHAAFTEMRARGANVTDIVILVVAADDGIMDQTVEAIHHIKAAKVPLIIAINKIDKHTANPNRVRQELLIHEIVVESMGGDVLEIEVSAKQKINLDKLEEAILAQAEILELKANPDRLGEGRIIESRIEKGRGPMATVLIQRGTVKVGDIFVAGCELGKIRALTDAHGWKLTTAGPSSPIEILGFNGAPLAGDDFYIVENESRAREIVSFRQQRQRDLKMAKSRTTLEQMLHNVTDQVKELNVIIKSDVQGSAEAINGSLQKLSTTEVKIKSIHSAVGEINEGDVNLAKASQAIIIGFNVRANPQAREIARRDEIEIRYYSIIYDVIDEVKNLLSGMLEPTLQEKWIGNASIREVFSIPKVGKIAGCMVTSGIIKRGSKLRLLRDNIVIHEGNLKTLKRFKDEVKEVKENYECGMAFENYQDLRVGDVIECSEIENIKRTL